LRFYDINPGHREVFYSLEKSSLSEIITYPGEANKENIRLYVPSFVSHLVQKSLDDAKKTAFHLKAGRYFENYFSFEGAEASYIERILAARRHFIAAKAWDNAAELTLKLFWPLHAQNFTQWALDLLNELEIEALSNHLKYHMQRRLGLLHYYRGAYFLSWDNYKEALALVRDEDERYRLYSEILPVELFVNPGFNSNDRSVFKGIFHSLANPPPGEIIKAGSTAIYHYYKEIQIQTTYLLECKIFLVGSGNVGKTTLMKKLKDGHFIVEPGKEETTRGVDIQSWQLSCPFPDGQVRDVKIHFWDFVGQDIFHATHQFFLTKRSLYLFVWDPRKEEEMRSFDYWLNAVKLFSAGGPLIMVMNKADMRIKHIDEASFQDKFPNIIQFHQVSCLTGQQIPELTETIRSALCRMPHLLDRLPKIWLDIRNDLKAKFENYITLEDYFALCRTHGIDNQKALSLSEYLHDLGIILHFHQDPILAETVILKPEWATGAVYALIDSLEIQQNKGRFNRANLNRYWDTTIYPTEKYSQILHLIEKFELCFNIAGTDDYIIPELLSSQRPQLDMNAYRSPSTRNLQLYYSYDFMPAGIITRFICRLHKLIRHDHYWNNGVELEFHGSFALIVNDSAQKRIRISVSGTNNTQLMNDIRSHFDHIHETMNMKKEEHVFEEVPCICPKCAASEKPFSYRYKLLQILKSKNRDALCEKSSEDVPVGRLLNGLL
jgi:small GTP-binding protein